MGGPNIICTDRAVVALSTLTCRHRWGAHVRIIVRSISYDNRVRKISDLSLGASSCRQSFLRIHVRAGFANTATPTLSFAVVKLGTLTVVQVG